MNKTSFYKQVCKSILKTLGKEDFAKFVEYLDNDVNHDFIEAAKEIDYSVNPELYDSPAQKGA